MGVMKLEVLSPAGDLARLKAAVDFGADAVYLAGERLSMRAGSMFNMADLAAGIEYAHKNGALVYVAVNTFMRPGEADGTAGYLKEIAALSPDAFIVADLGVLALIQKHTPDIPVHISVQAGVTNADAATMYHELGASRVVLSRELSLDDITEIRSKTPPSLQLEAFVHGAMCMALSGRCLLSSFLTGRSANSGDCAQPCRWEYSLMERKREGQHFPLLEDEKGSYILNANDLCMIEHIDKMAAAGICSLKIEGRAKSHYYTAVATAAYRAAADRYMENPAAYTAPDWAVEELSKISHRAYSTGFYLDSKNAVETYETAGYIREYEVAAIALGYEDERIIARLKNRISSGVTLDCLPPRDKPFTFTADLFDESGNAIEVARNPEMTVLIPCDREVPAGSVLRVKVQGDQ